MNKFILLFALLFSTVLFCQSQESFKNKVKTADGKIYVGDIDSYLAKKVNFKDTPPGLKDNSIRVGEIVEIYGYMPRQRMRAILRGNPHVKFFAADGTPINVNSTVENSIAFDKVELSAGDYLYNAGRKYVTGIGLGLAGGVIIGISVGAEDADMRNTGLIIGGISMLSGAIVSFTGHYELMKAGKALNKEAITLSGAENGIGLAINF